MLSRCVRYGPPEGPGVEWRVIIGRWEVIVLAASWERSRREALSVSCVDHGWLFHDVSLEACMKSASAVHCVVILMV